MRIFLDSISLDMGCGNAMPYHHLSHLLTISESGVLLDSRP